MKFRYNMPLNNITTVALGNKSMLKLELNGTILESLQTKYDKIF